MSGGSPINFRHHIPWSYRIDVFLVIVGAYVFIALMAGSFISYSNNQKIQSLKGSPEYAFFVSHRDAICAMVARFGRIRTAVAKNEGLEPDNEQAKAQEQAVFSDAQRIPGLVSMSQRLRDTLIQELSRPNLPYDTKPLIMGIAATKIVVDKVNELISIGNLGVTLAFIVLFAILLAAYLAFQINGVFHTPQLIVVYRHPQFPFLFLQLATVILAPFFLLTLIEAVYWPRYSELFSLFSGGTPAISLSDVDILTSVSIVLPTTSVISVLGSVDQAPTASALLWHLGLPAVLLSVASIVAMAIWLTRRFGWGVFLTGIVACAIVFVGITLLAASSILEMPAIDIPLFGELHFFNPRSGREIQWVFIAAAVTFILIFCLGRFLPTRFKKYPICAGYSGLLFSVTYLLAAYLAVDSKTSIIGYAALLTMITIFVVSLVETLLRISLNNLLNEPQP